MVEDRWQQQLETFAKYRFCNYQNSNKKPSSIHRKNCKNQSWMTNSESMNVQEGLYNQRIVTFAKGGHRKGSPQAGMLLAQWRTPHSSQGHAQLLVQSITLKLSVCPWNGESHTGSSRLWHLQTVVTNTAFIEQHPSLWAGHSAPPPPPIHLSPVSSTA